MIKSKRILYSILICFLQLNTDWMSYHYCSTFKLDGLIVVAFYSWIKGDKNYGIITS